MEIILVDFTITSPLNRRFQHMFGNIGPHELLQQVKKLFLPQCAAGFSLQAFSNMCGNRYMD